MSMKGVTVIICCYNSAERIGKTLQYLKQQQTVNLLWEVILVDNDCTDDTIHEALTFWGDYYVQLKVIVEQRAGIIYARQSGIQAALYDYIIFCDDDNWLNEVYIQTVYELFETNPEVGAIGGQSTVAIQDGETIPSWFKAEENAYAVGKQAMQSGDITYRHYLWGAGLASRKKLVENCFDSNFPFLLTGRNGIKITAGDDTEICNRIILMGFRLLYEERLQFQHFIPTSRLTEEYLIKLKKGFEASYGVLTLYSECITVAALPRRSKVPFLLDAILEKPFNKGKLKRMFYWLYGFSFYVNDEMRTIRSFYKKYCA